MSFKRGDTVRWLLVDPVSQGAQGYHNPYFTNQARLALHRATLLLVITALGGTRLSAAPQGGWYNHRH